MRSHPGVSGAELDEEVATFLIADFVDSTGTSVCLDSGIGAVGSLDGSGLWGSFMGEIFKTSKETR
jgi:hypothetical protein